VTFSELKLDVVILSCAVSAGIHAALVPDHFDEGAGPGIGFVLATVLLSVLAVALTRSPSQPVLLAAVVVFAGLIVAYVVVLVAGLPVLHPEGCSSGRRASRLRGVDRRCRISAATTSTTSRPRRQTTRC
jgi:hypothetical protein